jgi:riboflavin kinase/FMN adenylyltransferase
LEYIKELEAIRTDIPSVVTLGKFDGVHRGHRKLIGRVLELGRQHGYRTVVFTFDISPQVRMGSAKANMLMTNEERRLFLKKMGVDVLVECPFTDQVRNMEAEDFVDQVLCGKLKMACAVVGTDFHFGRGRRGNPEFLRRTGLQNGFSVEILQKEKEGARDISSTYIREELEAGRMEQVNRLLGYPYFICGKIVHGRHKGHSFGYPTINQIPAPEKLLPPWGVYVSRTRIGGKTYNSVTNIGKKPTVKGKEVGAETYLFGCSENLYGQEARVELLSFQRPERKFESVEALIAQLHRDAEEAEEYIRDFS